jgi:hypothetical protein
MYILPGLIFAFLGTFFGYMLNNQYHDGINHDRPAADECSQDLFAADKRVCGWM